MPDLELTHSTPRIDRFPRPLPGLRPGQLARRPAAGLGYEGADLDDEGVSGIIARREGCPVLQAQPRRWRVRLPEQDHHPARARRSGRRPPLAGPRQSRPARSGRLRRGGDRAVTTERTATQSGRCSGRSPCLPASPPPGCRSPCPRSRTSTKLLACTPCAWRWVGRVQVSSRIRGFTASDAEFPGEVCRIPNGTPTPAAPGE